MKVNVISESVTMKEQGVHTAFAETVSALRDYTDADVATNVTRPADIIHIHTVGPYSLQKLLFGRGAKVVSAHVTPDSFVGSLIGARYWYGLAKAYLRWFYNRADGVLAVSQEVVDELQKMGVRKPVYLVPNTIRTEAFEPRKGRRSEVRKQLGLGEKDFVVIGVGQVQPRKRIDSFVAAAKALPNVKFEWVGGIPFKQLAAGYGEMEQVMKATHDNMVFTGIIKREKLVDYYHAADLFFLPSIQETFGLVIVEAAAAGLPVLLRDIEQYKDTFGEGYERGTDETFSKIIKRFKTDDEYYAKWKAAAREIADRYDAKAGATQLMDVYQKVIQVRAANQKNGAMV